MARLRIYYDEAIRRRLPPVCMKCGARADEYVAKTFNWYPPWVIIFVFCGLLPLLIVALLTVKRMRVDAPMCDEHRNHWSKRNLFTWLGFLGVVVLGIVFAIVHSAMEPQDAQNKDLSVGGIMALVWVGLFLVWLFAAAIYTQSAIRPVEITDDTITLGKLSPDFVEALEDDRDRFEDERRERRRRGREGDRDEGDDREVADR